MKAVKRSVTSSRESRSHSESYRSCVLICAGEIRSEHRCRPSPTTPEKEKAAIDEGGKEINDEFKGIRIAKRTILALRSHSH
ncbi:hypothetical protein TIFTF001_044945 [Ficus carica]|uniref:Uncharacterized protein n=1 Tax=Ficus carica TaxID=3494 RepID=A0AA88CXY2_FICCA|nr:hypothetical protein TIFTF001_044945 [Ficus carica]